MSGTPESEYFMNGENSNVMFLVDGKHLPAIKVLLSLKSDVFRDMFSGDINEPEVRVIVIEDTTYEAFKTLIRFLYFDELILKDDNDFEVIRELYRLSDRYLVPILGDRITSYLLTKSDKVIRDRNEDFETKWFIFKSIGKIAFELKIHCLMENVMIFIGKHLNHFLRTDSKDLNKLNDMTDGRLLELLANKCRNPYKQLTELKYSLNQVKMFECQRCRAVNQVHYVNTSTQCYRCKVFFCQSNYIQKFRKQFIGCFYS